MTEAAETKLARLEERQDAMSERVDKLEAAVQTITTGMNKVSLQVALVSWKIGVIIGVLLFLGQIALKKLGLS